MMTSYWAPVVPVLEDDLVHQLLVDGPPAIIALLIPGVSMYLSLYSLARGWIWMSRMVVLPTLLLFWASILVAPVRCLALRAVFDFGSKYVSFVALSYFAMLMDFTYIFASIRSRLPGNTRHLPQRQVECSHLSQLPLGL